VESSQCHRGESLPREMTTKNWQRVVEKLRNMDRREFLDRSRQELSKRTDVALARCGYAFARGAQPSARVQSGVFFFKPEQVGGLLQLIHQRIPEQAKNIISLAERICSHRFDLLGYEDLDYGPSIDWHFDRVHDKTAPRKPFYRIHYLDFAEVGDSKVIWELNRHQHLVTLAKAYRLTGEERFAREIISQWKSWHAQNPYPIGINWASSLEVGFRSLSWIWVLALLEDTTLLTPEFRRDYLHAQALNGRHLERYLSTYFSPNTHLLGEGVALFFLGTLYPGLHGADRWKAQGWRIILQEAERQVNSDGFHFEQSTYYHVYALDFFLHAGLLASANGVKLPRSFEQILERMMNALCLLGGAGPPPSFGDDDGGRLFDPRRNRDEHLLDPLSTGAVLFGRGDFKSLAGNLHEEAIWLLGESGVGQWDRLEPKSALLKSSALPDSGIYVLALAQSGSQLIIKGGASKAQSRGHAHADALSLCLQSSGGSLLIDPGACEYVGEGGERDLYRSTSMHNTLMVDGEDQAEPNGPFSWKQEIVARTDQWITGQTFSLFIGSHDAYARLAQPVRHQRWVVTLNPGIVVVRDLVEGEGEHRLDLAWRLASELQLEGEHLFRFKKSQQALAVLPVQNHGWSEEIQMGPWSPVYGARSTTAVLKFHATSRLPADFVTLIVPLLESAAPPGQFRRLRQEDTTEAIHAYCYEAEERDHRFFFGGSGKPWKCGAVASDAEFVCLTRQQRAQAADVILCNGSYVEVEGKRVLSMMHSVSRCELVNGKTTQVFCSEPDGMREPSTAGDIVG
jgi:hypothetical protein